MSNDKKVTIMCQGKTDYTVEGFAVNGMLAIPKDEDGVAYVTRAQAMDFFDLAHAGNWRIDEVQLINEVTAFLQRTPGAVRVFEDLGPENLAASFATTLHKVLHAKVIEDMAIVLKHITLAVIPSAQDNSYNVVHMSNAKPVGVIYKESDGYFVFAPTNAGYWDEPTLAEVTYTLQAMNAGWRAKVMADQSVGNG